MDEACYQHKIRKRLHAIEKYLGSFKTHSIVFRNVGIFHQNNKIQRKICEGFFWKFFGEIFFTQNLPNKIII